MATIKDRVPIAGGFLCILGDPNFVEFSGKKWVFHRERYRKLITLCSNEGMSIVRKALTVPFYKPKDLEHVLTPYGLAEDAFDLTKRNDWYWDILLAMKAIDESVRVVGRYDIINGCDFQPEAPDNHWHWFVPWINNVNGFKSVYERKAWPFYSDLCEEAVHQLGPEMIYATGNEVDQPGAVDLFVNVIVPLFKKKVFTPERFVYGAMMAESPYVNPPIWETDPKGRKYLTHYPSPVREGTLGVMKKFAGELLNEKAKLLIYRDVHSVGSPLYDEVRVDGPRAHQMEECWGKYPIRKWPSPDGKKLHPTDPRASKCDVDFDGARISAETWEAMAPRILKACPPEIGGMKQCTVLEHCPQTGDPACISYTIRGISRGVEKVGYGISQNRGRFPFVASGDPDPVFPPDPPVPPKPPEPKPQEPPEPPKPKPPEPPSTPPVPPHPWIKDHWGWVALAALLTLLALSIFL